MIQSQVARMSHNTFHATRSFDILGDPAAIYLTKFQFTEPRHNIHMLGELVIVSL